MILFQIIMNIVIDVKATTIVTEITPIKTEKVGRVVRTEIAIATGTVDFTETEKGTGTETEIDTNPGGDREVAIRDGKKKKEKPANEIDIGMTIETVIGIGFTEWF